MKERAEAPTGKFAARREFPLGAERVIVIDRADYRLRMAEQGDGDIFNSEEVDSVLDVLKDMT